MDFYLHREGRNEGSFPLEVLRRRRAQGELTGTEYVWREGMMDWQLLDTVLHETASAVGGLVPPPVPPSAMKRPPVPSTNWDVALAYVLMVMLVVATGIFVVTHPGVFARRLISSMEPTGRVRYETALQIAAKPVKWNNSTLTWREAETRRREFRVPQWVGAYQEHGDHSAACDAEALAFLNAWLDRVYDTNRSALEQSAEKLAGDPSCTDPLLLTAAAINSANTVDKARRLETALRGFENSKYNAYVRLLATLELETAVVRDTNRVAVLDAAALPLVRQAFADGSFPAKYQEECRAIFVGGWGDAFFSRNALAVIQIVKDAGKPYEWLALALEGRNDINEAWKARGHEFAPKVTETGWQGFSTNMALARRALTRAWELQPSRPESASDMISVAAGDAGIVEMRLWFDRAVSAQLDYSAAWSQMRNGFRPRWYGSLEAMRRFSLMAAGTARFDTTVPAEFLNSVRDIETDQDGPRTGEIYGRTNIWPALQYVLDGYVSSPQAPVEATTWRGKYAVAAFLAKRYDVARIQLESLGWNLSQADREGWGADLSLIGPEVGAHTGAYAATVAQAESARDAGDSTRALELYNQILGESRVGPRVRHFARCRAAALELESRLQKGEWVDFMPDPTNDLNWVFSPNTPVVITNGTVEVHGIPGGHLLYSRVRVGRNFEVKGQFEFVKSTIATFEAGLDMGMPDFDAPHGDYDWFSFRIYQTTNGTQTVSFGIAGTTESIARPAFLQEGTNTFLVRLTGDKCTASVNRVDVFKNQKAPGTIKSSENGFLLAFAAYHNYHETVRYESVQVRKILQ